MVTLKQATKRHVALIQASIRRGGAMPGDEHHKHARARAARLSADRYIDGMRVDLLLAKIMAPNAR